MEEAYTSMLRNQTRLESDKGMRMQKRPGPSNGRAVEDLGSDFMRGSSARAGKRPGRVEDLYHDKGTSQKSSRIVVKKPRPSDFNEDEDESSNDELNIISAGPKTRAVSRSVASDKQLVSEGSFDSTGRSAEGAIIDGQFHPWGPGGDVYAQRSNGLKGMKFKKISQRTDTSPSSSTSATLSTRNDSSLGRSRVGTKAASAPFKPPTVTQPSKGPYNISESKRMAAADHGKCEGPGHSGDAMATPRASTRPKPRPIHSPLKLQHQRTTRQSEKQLASWPMDNLSPLKETSNAIPKGKARGRDCFSDDDPVSFDDRRKDSILKFPMEQYSPIKPKKETQAFPMSPPRKSKFTKDQTSQDSRPPLSPQSSSDSSDSSDKRLPATAPTVPSKSLASFPVLSPISSPVRNKSSKKRQETQTTNTTYARPKRKATAVDRRIVSASESGESSEEEIPHPPPMSKKKKKPALQPFPMDTQVLESIDRTDRGSPNSMEITSGNADVNADARDGRRARGGDEILRELMRSDDMPTSDEEMFMDPDVDPSTLCPWCDEPLPPSPSPLLQRLMAAARLRSHKDPRLSNLHGLRAPATIFVNVCHRHQFEQHHFPLAQQRGWPTEIEWDGLCERIAKFKTKLQAIVDDVDEDFEPGRERLQDDGDVDDADDADDDEFLLDYRPRKGSLFWIEVVRAAKKRGSRSASGMRAQMSNFTKTQPGYYGELGAMVLSQTLYDMFPPLGFPLNSTLPLTPADFVQRVLLPEAAVSLIMEDMQKTRKDAIFTMRESAQYGVAMFPDDNTEGNSIGDIIGRKRANVRRRQLEQEERGEAIDGRRSSTTLSESTGFGPARRNMGRKATTRNYAESDDDVRVATDSSLPDTFKVQKPRIKRATKTRKPPSDEAAPLAIEVSDASSSNHPTKPRPKPRPRVKDGFGSEVDHDTELEFPSASDAEPPLDQQTIASQRHIKFNSKGKAQVSMRSEVGSWQLDADATPKPKRTKPKLKESICRSSSMADFGLRIEPTTVTGVSSSNGVSHKVGDGWVPSLRRNFESDEEL